MAKPEWGVKRVCQSCAVKFYDLNRSPITCPKCAAPFDPEALLKSRRSRPPPVKATKPEPEAGADTAAGKPPENDARPDGVDADADAGAVAGRPGDDEDDDSVLQDTSELGDDGVSEVVVTDNGHS